MLLLNPVPAPPLKQFTVSQPSQYQWLVRTLWLIWEQIGIQIGLIKSSLKMLLNHRSLGCFHRFLFHLYVLMAKELLLLVTKKNIPLVL